MILALTTILASGAAIGTQVSLALAWVVGMFALVEIILVSHVAAPAKTEAVLRLLPNVLGNPLSHQDDSHSSGLLEGPSYTRPPSWRGLDVPEVLLSGDHARVESWRRQASEQRTRERRPDLWDRR